MSELLQEHNKTIFKAKMNQVVFTRNESNQDLKDLQKQRTIQLVTKKITVQNSTFQKTDGMQTKASSTVADRVAKL